MVRAAIADLSVFEREVYLLAARDGLSDAAIGQRLGIDGREVRRHLACALMRMAGALEDERAN
jgi:DNA-directed RNA polymerase specialized sigma24 family protein